MNFDSEQINIIKKMASELFNEKDIAFAIGLNKKDAFDFCLVASDIYSDVGSIIYAERIKTKSEIRSRVISNAIAGSSQAISQVIEFFNDINFDDGY